MNSTRSRLTWVVAGVLAVAMAAPAVAQQEPAASQQVRERTTQQVGNESASEALQVREQEQQQVRERLYGEPLMSAEERNQFRQQLQGTQDPQARQQLMEQHRRAMQERAKQRGVALSPDGSEMMPGKTDRTQQRLHDGSGAGDMQRDRRRDRDMTHRPAGAGMGGGGGRGGRQ